MLQKSCLSEVLFCSYGDFHHHKIGKIKQAVHCGYTSTFDFVFSSYCSENDGALQFLNIKMIYEKTKKILLIYDNDAE